MSAELPLEDDGQPIDASKLRALLRRKYPGDQFAMLYEVRDAAGFAARRSADVMVIGLWPSRGCMVEGMELKVSRSDWLRELKKPQKAEAFFPYCDRWWIIAANKDVVRLEELPQTWGLMIPRAGGMGVLRQAPDLKPEPVDRYLLAAMMKRATDTAADSPEVQARIEARVTAATANLKASETYELARLKNSNEELRKAIEAFEQTSGLRISSYAGERLGEAVAVVMRGEHKRRLRELGIIKQQAKNLVEWLEQHVPDEPEQVDG